MNKKRVLLIAGGGTLGTYTAEELLSLGHFVDVICLEDKISENEKLTFYKADATDEYLEKLFSKNHYDAIVNFIHYTDVEKYKKTYKLLIKNTKHLVFLSSYRVYADTKHPITENSPKLIDKITDEEFLKEENYAIPKSKCEIFLINECTGENWTVVRPVISFSDKRLDLLMYSELQVLDYADSGEELLLPDRAKNLTAGLDWAGNTGKLIASLLFNPDTFGECYTISSAQNLTWGEVAEAYSEVTGLKVKWADEESFLKHPMFEFQYKRWGYFYDRVYDRRIDNSKVLKVTGLKKEDFKTIKDGIKIETDKLKGEKIK